MELKSLGRKTDLIFARFAGEVVDRGWKPMPIITRPAFTNRSASRRPKSSFN